MPSGLARSGEARLSKHAPWSFELGMKAVGRFRGGCLPPENSGIGALGSAGMRSAERQRLQHPRQMWLVDDLGGQRTDRPLEEDAGACSGITAAGEQAGAH